MPHTEGQQGLRGGGPREALPATAGRLHRAHRTRDVVQGVNAGASSCIVLMCLIVTVPKLQLVHTDNPLAAQILGAKGVEHVWARQFLEVPPKGQVGVCWLGRDLLR